MIHKNEQPTVWVVQENSKINIAPALRFGNLEALLPESSDIILNAAHVVELLRRKLSAWKRGDYILAIGDPAAIAIVAALVSERCKNEFNVLKWDKQAKVYIPVRVIL